MLNSREALERKLVAEARYHRDLAAMYRNRVINKLTWKQFLAFQAGNLKTSSKKIIAWQASEREARALAAAASSRLDTLLSLEVIEGGQNAYFPSAPIGRLRAVANA